jgi:hypothetical protein
MPFEPGIPPLIDANAWQSDPSIRAAQAESMWAILQMGQDRAGLLVRDMEQLRLEPTQILGALQAQAFYERDQLTRAHHQQRHPLALAPPDSSGLRPAVPVHSVAVGDVAPVSDHADAGTAATNTLMNLAHRPRTVGGAATASCAAPAMSAQTRVDCHSRFHVLWKVHRAIDAAQRRWRWLASYPEEVASASVVVTAMVSTILLAWGPTRPIGIAAWLMCCVWSVALSSESVIEATRRGLRACGELCGWMAAALRTGIDCGRTDCRSCAVLRSEG